MESYFVYVGTHLAGFTSMHENKDSTILVKECSCGGESFVEPIVCFTPNLTLDTSAPLHFPAPYLDHDLLY
jgi:hypothetical protein